MAEPQPPAPLTTQDGRAYVKTASGELASVPVEQLDTFLQEGRGALASPEDVAAREAQRQHGEGIGNELAAFGEGALSGATVGLSDVAAKYIAPDYAEGLAARREYNPIAAGAGEVAGLVGSTLLTGGESLAAKGAAALTAPARGLMAAGTLATEGTARLLGAEAAKGVLGQAVRTGAAYAVGGAVEGALFGAAKRATDDFLNDREITTERVMTGAGAGALTGAVLGGVLGGGMSLAESAGKAVWPQLQKVISQGDSIDDFVGERAYKAALGGRNLRDVQKSERVGGPSEIGKTLLAEGVVTPTSTIDDIAQAAKTRADEYGSRIGQIVDELDTLKPANEAPLDGKTLWSRIEADVIAPLKASPVKRDVGELIENRLGYLKDALVREDAPPLTFRDLWTLRKDFDDRLRWDQAPAPFTAPNPALEGLRDARKTMEAFWQEAGDNAAKATGNEALMAEFRAAKRSYSHLVHAKEIANKAIARDSANRMLSPSDYGFGAVVAGADAITGGGASLATLAYGLASGAVHKFFRERGAAMFAGSMYAVRGAPKIVMDARAGEAAAEAASKSVVQKLIEKTPAALKRATNGAVAGATRAISSPDSYEKAVRTAKEYADPTSPKREEMRRQAASVRVYDPELAQSMEAHTQRVADFLAQKAGELSSEPRPGDPFGHLRKPRHDAAKAAKLARYVDAATNPKGVLKRISEGDIVREDVEALQTLYPRMYQNVVADVLSELGKVTKLPPYESRLALGHLLNAPADPTMQPDFLRTVQEIAASGVGVEAERAANGPVGEPSLSPSQRREPKLTNVFATQADLQSVQGSRLQ